MQRYLALFLSVVMIVQLILPAAALAQTTETYARITAKSLNVRSGPGTTFDVVDKVTLGMELFTLRREADWIQIELPSGATGWVSTRYAELIEVIVSTPADPPPTPTAPPPPEPTPTRNPQVSSGGGGGLGTFFKWTCLVGAGALGGLAFYEHSQGNDSYDEYKQLVLDNMDAEAEVKWNDANDHDDKAQLYGIVAGSLFGVFLVQQFFMGGGGNNYDTIGSKPMPLSWNPQTKEIRASVTLARF